MSNLYFKAIHSISIVKFSSIYDISSKSVRIISVIGAKFDALPIHSSSTRLKFGKPKQRPAVYRRPVDWLPFQWHRKPKFDLFTQSGDKIKENPVDPTLPKPDFEFSEELKKANETVKHTFSLATGSKGDAREVYKRHLLKRVQRHPFDYDSLEVKIALMTIQVRSLFEHHKEHWKKEVRVCRVATPIIIQKRNKLLKQLWKIDEERFNWLLEELQLYYNPPLMGVKMEKYCKKWDLRRLTKEYCEKVVKEKKAAYHEELKIQQQDFLEEKKQILAWIEEEEKILQSM